MGVVVEIIGYLHSIPIFRPKYINLTFYSSVVSDTPYFEWTKPGVGAHALYMLVVGVVMFLILLIKEYRLSSEVILSL